MYVFKRHGMKKNEIIFPLSFDLTTIWLALI